jgi:hypothetical protein
MLSILPYARLLIVTESVTNYQTSKTLFHRIRLFQAVQAAWFLGVPPR